MNTILNRIEESWKRGKGVHFLFNEKSLSSKTMATDDSVSSKSVYSSDSVSSKSVYSSDSVSSKSVYSSDSVSSKSFSSSKSLSSFISASILSNREKAASIIQIISDHSSPTDTPYWNEKGKTTLQKLFEPIVCDLYSEYDFGISGNLYKIDEEAKTHTSNRTTFHIMRANSTLPSLLITTNNKGIVNVQRIQSNILENNKKNRINDKIRKYRRDIELDYGNIYSNKEHIYNRTNDLYRKRNDIYIKRKYDTKNYLQNDYNEKYVNL